MAVKRKDYVVTQGYPFELHLVWEVESFPDWDFRFTIYDAGDSDVNKTVGNGITVDVPSLSTALKVLTDQIPSGSYRYNNDYKEPGDEWRQLTTGQIIIKNPRAKL